MKNSVIPVIDSIVVATVLFFSHQSFAVVFLGAWFAADVSLAIQILKEIRDK